MKNKIEKEERLLTEEEKKYVIDGYNKIRWSNFAIIFGVTFIIYVLLGLLWGLIWWSVDQDITMGLRQGFGLLFFITGITSIWIIYYFLNLHFLFLKALYTFLPSFIYSINNAFFLLPLIFNNNPTNIRFVNNELPP